MTSLPTLNPLFHQIVKTRLAVLLNQKAHSFTQLKSALNITDGNLDAHLRKLSSAGYIHSQMVLERRPHTIYELSNNGKVAFKQYQETMRILIKYPQSLLDEE